MFADEAFPSGIDEARIGGIGGDRFLIVERSAVADQRCRRCPGPAAVGGPAHEDRTECVGLEQATAERDSYLVRRAVGRNGDPGVADARIVAAVGRVTSRASGQRRLRARPRASAVEGHAGRLPGSTAIRPAILLPHADVVIRIGGIAREHRLDLGATV